MLSFMIFHLPVTFSSNFCFQHMQMGQLIVPCLSPILDHYFVKSLLTISIFFLRLHIVIIPLLRLFH